MLAFLVYMDYPKARRVSWCFGGIIVMLGIGLFIFQGLNAFVFKF